MASTNDLPTAYGRITVKLTTAQAQPPIPASSSRTTGERALTVSIMMVSISRGPAMLLRAALLLPLMFSACKKSDGIAGDDDAAVIGALVAAEETGLKLGPKLGALSKGMLGLRLPAQGAESIFAPSVGVSDLGAVPPLTAKGDDRLESQAWPVAKETRYVAEVDLWRPLLDAVASFDHARLYLIDGHHPEGDMLRYESKVGFEALAKMKSGEWRSLRGRMQLTWQRVKPIAGAPVPDWQITSWTTEEMKYNASARRLFVEAVDTALGSARDREKVRRSGHYEATVKYYREGMKSPPHPYFAPISANQKEGIAVADVDGDGFDDIYITVRIGTNMFLRNLGDGTFREEAAQHGLALPGHTMCALFADFDNDGDLDVMLGRSLLKTAYLENRDGKFFQYPSPPHFPMAVISMSAADYNRDGLLDVYLCTYRPAAPTGASPAGGVAAVDEGSFDWPDEFFSPELAREYRRREAEHRQRKGGTVLDQIGPPNVLLINRGHGRFETDPGNQNVEVWRNSMQATWGDYNEDGWPDLYIANDWGLDALFRNDGPAGFKDVSAEVGVTSYGYAMGASWGDYDNDGLEDLYISNMYSEPGRRITRRIADLDKMFVESAAGNWLYHRESNGKFRQVAGLEPPALPVIDAGWSWGGCFADFDNDSFLDLYVLSGYFTAPEGLASDLDLESNLWRTMVRTDENLARASFRFSPEWKRTPAPDNLGPQIDARLAGVDRQGDKVWVHSLNGNERNHYFANRGGRTFEDLSALSGLDSPADSRGFALLDYDRDGWQDVALVNANQPLFNLYHNEMPAAGMKGGMIAIRFVGGNKTPSPSREFACRDGYGARVTVHFGGTRLIREHRCGDGWSTQNSATMIVGIGGHPTVESLTVRWPSGKTSSTQAVPEGTLLTVYENPADGPAGESFTRAVYRVEPKAGTSSLSAKPVFAVRTADLGARPARLRVYTTFATTSASGIKELPALRQLKEELGSKGVDVAVVPVDATDDIPKLRDYALQWKPTSRLVNIAPDKRAEALLAFTGALGQAPPMPSTVITDESGRILAAQPGVPGVAEVRKLLELVSTDRAAE